MSMSHEPALPPEAGAAARSTFWRRVLTGLALAAVAVIGFAGAALYTLWHQLNPQGGAVPSLWNPGSIAFAHRDRLNILCLGLDYNHDSKGMPYTKWVRTDTMFVVSVDREAKTLNVLSIPRDSRVAIPGYGFDKINAAFSLKENGDLALTKQVVENLLGVPIDETVVIREYAARRVVDAMGGIDLDVEKNMDYDDHWGDLHIHLKQGMQHLDGRQAVGYIRFRHDAEGDRGRIRRQQQFLAAMIRRFKSLDGLSHLNPVVRALRDNVTTSLQFNEIVDLALLYRHFDRRQMQAAKLDGADAFYGGESFIELDEKAKDRLVARLLKGDDRILPADVRVEILNGSGVAGAAARLAQYFAARGYQVVRVGNAPREESNQTHLVDHRNNPQLADAVARLLGAVPTVRDTRPDSAADITIVLGKDWRAQNSRASARAWSALHSASRPRRS